VLAAAGIPVMLAAAGRAPSSGLLVACLLYSATLVAMLVCSALFHHGLIRAERCLLRRLDHAAIFLVIAGTYTPFTTCLLHGFWALAMTAAIWLGAVVGALVKLLRPLPYPGFSGFGYLALAGIALIGLRPVLSAVDDASLILIIAGLAIYATGAVIRRYRSLRYRNTIWHTMVVSAASCHFAAILHGVVLQSA
jgi:hemolysin III